MRGHRVDLSKLIGSNLVPAFFLVLCLLGGWASRLQVSFILNEVVERLARNALLVLSLIFPALAGMGMNFAIVVGAMAGQIGLITVKILDLGGLAGIGLASLISTPFAVLFGYLTGRVLNITKGREMITSLILGFFAMGLYQLVFLLFAGTVIPIPDKSILLPGGIGLKNAIDLKLIQYALDDLLMVRLGPMRAPVATLLLVAFFCLSMRSFMRTKWGQDFRAVGQDMHVASVAGIDVDRTRLVAMVMSTVLAAWGQIVFLQNIGTLQTYSSHEQVGMFAVASLLVGGATVAKASIANAVVGTLLFHALFVVSPNAGKNLFGDPQIGEFFRSFVAYGVIALSLAMHAMQKQMESSRGMRER